MVKKKRESLCIVWEEEEENIFIYCNMSIKLISIQISHLIDMHPNCNADNSI